MKLLENKTYYTILIVYKFPTLQITFKEKKDSEIQQKAKFHDHQQKEQILSDYCH